MVLTTEPLEFIQFSIQYAGSLGCWDKRLVECLMFQVFFSKFLATFFAKILSIYFLNFYNFTIIKIKNFECTKSIKKLWKKILGTSDTWSTIRLSHRPSKPVYYIVDCRIYTVFLSIPYLHFFCQYPLKNYLAQKSIKQGNGVD